MGLYGIYRLSVLVIVSVALYVGLVIMLGFEAYSRISTEVHYRSQYPNDWKERYYEEQHVSVAKTNQDIAVAVGGMILLPTTIFLIYKQVVPNRGAPSRSRRRRRSSSSA